MMRPRVPHPVHRPRFRVKDQQKIKKRALSSAAVIESPSVGRRPPFPALRRRATVRFHLTTDRLRRELHARRGLKLRFRKILGAGGCGVVGLYEVSHPRGESETREVAVKVDLGDTASEAAKASVLREKAFGDALARAPHIIQRIRMATLGNGPPGPAIPAREGQDDRISDKYPFDPDTDRHFWEPGYDTDEYWLGPDNPDFD